MPMPPRTRGNFAGADVAAQTRPADALQAGDGAGPVDELVRDLELRAAFLRRIDLEVGDVAFLLQDAGDLALDLRIRHGEFRSCARRAALRTRVRRSAMGSVISFGTQLGGRL